MSENNHEILQPRATGETDALNERDLNRITSRLGSLILDETTVLAEHQKDAFDDIVDFFQNGGREGYVQLPTGTGKTVLFVEICRRFIESTPEDEPKPRAIVLVPSVDLANQTVGSVDPTTGKKRGFKGFAPDIDARAHHHKIPLKERDRNLTEADVLVATYNTFRNLVDGFSLAESKTKEEWQLDHLQHKINAGSYSRQKTAMDLERATFLKESFQTQEIDHARNSASTMLASTSLVKSLTAKEVDILKKIIEITESPKEKSHQLGQIRMMLKKTASEKVIVGFGKLKGRVEKVKETKRRNLQIERLKKKGEPLSEELLLLDNEDDEYIDIEDTSTANDGLSEFEKFALDFLWLNRPDRTISTAVLRNASKRKEYYDYTDKIGNLRSQVLHEKNLANAANHNAVIVEAVKRFDLIVCDEAHRSIGSQTWEAIREYARMKGVAILGLTATDEYPDRHMEDYFEAKAHELTKQEAIKKEIVNPLAIFVHETGLQYDHVSLDPNGDYDKLTIRQMRYSEARNQIGADYAKLLSEHGYHGIVSAIPGDEGAHAKLLAELLNQQEIHDPRTGLTRHIRARYVLQESENREEYYKQFEAGELDWLVYVDVLREGWDSDRAKAIINMRPTRSPLLATQRLGRIGRTNEGAPTSIAIDLHDGITGDETSAILPPVLAADIFDLDSVEQGYVIGRQADNSQGLLRTLKEKLPYPITAHHTRFITLLGSAMLVESNGVVRSKESPNSNNEWLTFESLQKGFDGFLPKEIVLDAVEGNHSVVRTRQGRLGQKLIPLFNVSDIRNLHQDKPEINPWKLYIDDKDQKWITPEGCVKMFSKINPRLTSEEISDVIRTLEAESGASFTRTVGRVRLSYLDSSAKRFGFSNLYALDEIISRVAPVIKTTLR